MAQKGILVTGGTGLVGAYVVGMLLMRGERPVVFDVALNERLLRAVDVDVKSIELVRGDILDLPGLISALRDHRIDRIIHLAAFLGEEVQRRPYSGVRLNLLGTVNVLEAARLEKVSRVIFPSSGTVYLGSLGEGLQKIDETIPLNPPSIYAATKASSEFLGRTYAQRFGFEFVSVRYVGGLYGPSPVALKATRERAIQEMVRAALKGDEASIQWPYGPSEILYGKDAANGTVLACLKDKLREKIFHIGSGELVSGDEILHALKKNFPESRITLAKGSNPMPYPEVRIPTDLSRSREQLGYESDYPLEKALEDYAATLRRLENI
ncbi:MAG: NAD(P)-dependent oxidoreductase [Deltaproteobacteria bacterium]|nr:NAD(P)-dependent oxidoreductase [Deltaproteobacteria bacterium]